jgi:hypothetical protein
MNIDKMTQLAIWLEAGAPHIIFNMREGIDVDPYERIPEIIKDQVGVGECGTTCCIAGYAVSLEKNQFSLHPIHGNGPAWCDVRDDALRILGLPLQKDHGGMGHALFDFRLAPKDCTPQQAARAVRRMISNPRTRNPWKYVK